MKFYCDACNTKYAISDDKVHGKVLKVRCKNCGNIITVREAVAPIHGVPVETDPTISSPTHLPTDDQLSVPTTQWYYALNGQTFGPFTLEGLRRKYATAEIGDATYVWHERLGAWKPVANEPAFADSLAIGHKIVPSRKTLGFTGPVEAIRVVHGGPSAQRAGAVPNAAHAREEPAPKQEARPPSRTTQPPPRPVLKSEPQPQRPQPKVERPEPKPAPAVSSPPVPESPRRPTPISRPVPEPRPIKDARPGNLDRLRASLGSSLGTEDESFEPLPQPVGSEAIFTYAAGVVPASAESSQDIRTAIANDAVNFELPPRTKAPKPSPSSTSDILERAIGPTPEPPSEVSEVEDSGVIPFFPESPSPAAIKGATGREATSESLLVDVSSMKKAERKRGVAAVVVAAVLLVGIGGFGLSRIGGSKDVPTETPQPSGQQNVHKDDLVIPTYKKEDVAKMATLDLEDELLFSEDEVVVEPPENPLPEKVENPLPEKVVVPKVAPPKPRITKQPSVSAAPAAVVTPVDTPPEEVDPLKALLAPRAHRGSTEIKAPEDKLLTAQSEGLSKDQARRGFQRVKKSIRDCRERHNRYNAKLEAGKLKISVTVEPSGEVSSFTLNPRSVQNTEFANCMNSHQGRWTFAKFTGKAVVINTSIIIQ